MPFSPTESPSIGLGLLKAGLLKAGIPCKVLYLNLTFAEWLRNNICDVPDPYNMIRRRFSLLGDWIFSHDLFGEQVGYTHQSLKEFLDRYRQYLVSPEAGAREGQESLIETVMRARAQAELFLDASLKSIEWERFDIVGFSLMFHQNIASLALAKRIKAIYPEKIIVLGGASCEAIMGESLHRLFPFVDVVCSGKADLIFPQLVQRLLNRLPIDDVAHIVYRHGDRSCSNLGLPALEPDLDSLPYPDYDEYFRQLHETHSDSSFSSWLPFETSRGCWWGEKSHCLFCSLNGTSMKYRSKSPDRVLEEINHLVGRYGIGCLVAVDNILGMHYFSDLLPELKRRQLNLQLAFATKANLTKDNIHLLREAGVCKIDPGIESLSTSVLRLLRKGCTALQNVQLLKWAQEEGLCLEWNILLGIPGEDPLEYPRMAELMRAIPHLQPPWGCTFIRLDRFSPYFMHPDEHGICNVRPLEVYDYIYPPAALPLSELAYYFNYDHANGRDPRTYVQPVVEAVEDWKRHQHATLRYSAEADSLVIQDCRQDTQTFSFRLKGLQKDIYEFCDQARTWQSIETRLCETTMEKRLPSVASHLLRDVRPIEVAGSGSMAPEEFDALRGETFEGEELAVFLRELTDRKLMVRELDSYLSLAIPCPDGTSSLSD